MLGPLEVRRDGQPVTVPGGKSAELLVRLALDAGELVRTERLIDDVWAGALDTRRNTVQSKITRLRRALGDPAVIAGSTDGYRLDVDPEHIDAFAVAHDAVASARLLLGGDLRVAAATSAAALARFTDDLVPSAGDGQWITPHRARFEELRTRLTETHFTARLDLGDTDDLVADLEATVAALPFQEALWQLLITALYRAGRQADSLATYQRVRALLAEELGLEPGPGLRQLEQQILVHDAALGVDVHRALRTTEAPAGNLPSMSVDLVGRDRDVDAVVELLGHERLVELVGAGGVGKTALAIAAARAWSDAETAPAGAWMARLEAATTADEVDDVLVAAFGVTGGDAALFERLRSAHGVLVLDNCEHVIGAAAAVTTRVLDAAPGLRVLCTTQVPLEVDGAIRYELAPLDLDDAIELFARRAAAQRTTEMASDPNSVRDLCRSLDGLPLAIELAAARTKTLPVDEITRRLVDRFAVLQDPSSSKPERRRALKATIGWSYDLLFPDDKRGLWALATFAGGATLPAVEFVLDTGLDVPASAAIDVVGRLAARSLLIIDDEDTAFTFRYRLLDSIRAFALEAGTDAGEIAPAAAAHARWFADLAAASTAGVRSHEQRRHLAVARTERANIDAALAWCTAHDPSLALDIVNGFGWAWVVLGDSRGAQRLQAALVAIGTAAPKRDRAIALLLAGWIEASTGDLATARRDVLEATDIAGEIEDNELQARCSSYLAYVVSHEGEWERALELTDRADALYRGLDRPWDQAANWLFAARAAISAGDPVRGRTARDEVLRWLTAVDDPWLHARGEAVLGELARLEHRFDDAVVHLRRAAEQSRQLGFLQTEAYQMSSLGRAQSQAGDDDAAAATLQLAIAKAEATGDVRLAALARVHLGRVLRALGRTADARAALESASVWHHTAGSGEQYALGECLLAALDAADGVTGAVDRLDALLEDARRTEKAHVEVFALDALARAALADGDDATARALCDQADERFATASHFITERDRVDAAVVRVTAPRPSPRPRG